MVGDERCDRDVAWAWKIGETQRNATQLHLQLGRTAPRRLSVSKMHSELAVENT